MRQDRDSHYCFCFLSFKGRGYLTGPDCAEGFGCLLEPTEDDLFNVMTPNALDPLFTNRKAKNHVVVRACYSPDHETGLVDVNKNILKTKIYGYKITGTATPCTWPGATIIAESHKMQKVTWQNKLGSKMPEFPFGHILTNKVTIHFRHCLYILRHI